MKGPPIPGETAARRGWTWALLLVLVALPLLLYRLAAKDLWDASEGRPPESAREMGWKGDYLVQYTNGDVDLTKPPLYAWLTALSFRLAGEETDWAARLPSVLATLGILLLAFGLASRIAGPRAGFLAGLVLLTQARFLWQARLAELETLLALGVGAAYLSLAVALDRPPGPGRTRAFACFHAALGFAFAVKGPVALVLVLPGAIAWALWTRRARALVSPAFLGTLPLFAVVGLSWYAAVVARDFAYLDTFVSFGRGDNVGHLRDPFYYLLEYPLYALPWTPLVLLGFSLPWARDLGDAAKNRLRLPLAAFVVTFLVMSCFHAKQTHYLIPIFPMAAVLAGVWLERALARTANDSRVVWAACALAVAIGGIGAAISPEVVRDAPSWPSLAWALPLGAVVVVLAGLSAMQARRGRLGSAVPLLFAAVLLLEGFGVGHGAPALNDTMSARTFLEGVAARVPPAAPLASTIFGSHSDHLWYLGRTVTLMEEPGLTAFLAGPGARYALVYSAEAKRLGPAATVLDRDPTFQKTNRSVALVANAEGAASR